MRWWVAVALLGLISLPLAGQEREGVRDLERVRRQAVAADSILRNYLHVGVRRAYLGVTVNTRSANTDSVGALIHSVSPNGPADRAGIQSGDIITKLDGESLTKGPPPARPIRANSSLPGLRLIELVARLEPNDTITVELRRGTATRRVEVVTAAPPQFVRTWRTPDGGTGYAIGTDSLIVEFDTGAMASGFRRDLLRDLRRGAPVAFLPPLFDLELAALNPDLAAYFGTASGILVISTPPGSTLNLKGGDVVLSVDGRQPTTPSHLLRILGSYQPSEAIRFDIMRTKRRMTITGTLR